MKFVMLAARPGEGEEFTFKCFLDIKGFVLKYIIQTYCKLFSIYLFTVLIFTLHLK